MAIEIRPYTEELIPAVKAFNQRLKAGGVGYQFPEHHIPDWLPQRDGRKIFEEYFLAVENDRDVRGTYILKHQELSVAGEIVPMAGYRLPISEGLLTKAYAAIGVQVLMNAMKRQPLLFALGFGGRSEPLAVMLMKLGWTFEEVPFFFLVHHPFPFLRNISNLRATGLKRALADLLAFSGIGWLGMKLVHLLLRKRRAKGPELRAELVEEFSDWADPLWEACKQEYALCAVRDLATLKILYPAGNKRFIRMKILRDGKVIGWAVLLLTQMSNAKHFGSMRVGSLVDCMASHEDASAVVRMATQHLTLAGADIIVSNQLDSAWGAALKDCGFLSGPSNFLFAVSKKLLERLQPFQAKVTSIHMNRGDGDGPINL
jgi:hypothetical protein